MNDHRLENGLHAIHHSQLEPSCNERVLDALVSSESAHIQEFRLYRELSREIDKKNDRVRYVDSEIYQRSQQQQQQDPRYSNPSSSTDIVNHDGSNSGFPSKVTSTSKANRQQQSSSSTARNQSQTSTSRFTGDESSFGSDPAGQNQRQLNNSNDDAHKNHPVFQDGNCQVCLLKGLRDDLTLVTKVIQERNEQILSELRARRPKTFQPQRFDQ